MRVFAKLILIVFVLFLSAPTIVTLIKKNTNTSLLFSYSEEEIHKQCKEVKADVKQYSDYPFLDLKINSSAKIVSENLSRHDKINAEIFSPPPEIV